jgi:hypothetical protein
MANGPGRLKAAPTSDRVAAPIRVFVGAAFRRPWGEGDANGRYLMSPRTNCTRPAMLDRFTRARARASIASDRSMPTSVTPARPSGNAMRPVPHPSSSTGPPTWIARLRQNGTSRLPSVRAFSQS